MLRFLMFVIFSLAFAAGCDTLAVEFGAITTGFAAPYVNQWFASTFLPSTPMGLPFFVAFTCFCLCCAISAVVGSIGKYVSGTFTTVLAVATLVLIQGWASVETLFGNGADLDVSIVMLAGATMGGLIAFVVSCVIYPSSDEEAVETGSRESEACKASSNALDD